jgi:hypothetical protein
MNQSKKTGLFAIAVLALLINASGCVFSSGPSRHTDCYGDIITYCETHYYNGDGTVDTSRDMITDIAQVEQEQLANAGRHYAAKFALSEEQGLKIAKTIDDFNTVQNRSDADIADFAKRLYGVDPTAIASAVGKAQAGDNSQLNQVVGEAAQNFNTTPENMKNIVKTLHGEMLERQGVKL